ncbi:MAG: type III polyketide synthase [Bacteroidota bacterium]
MLNLHLIDNKNNMPAFINAIGSAVPQNCIDQQQIADFMCSALQLDAVETRKLKALYRQTKIVKRHSVIGDYACEVKDFTFFPPTPDLEPFPTILPRMLSYRKYALPLCIEAVNNCFEKIGKNKLSELTHLITVSCTGMYAPGLDIDLVQYYDLNTTIKRTCINFMGCYGAFNALKLADSICKSEASAKVLIVSVELCTLHFQKKISDNNLLSNALFADGAAAVFLESSPNPLGISLLLKSFYCDLFEEGKQEMEWNIADFGFEMVLSSNVPKIVKEGVKILIDKLLENNHLSMEDIDLFAMHPGGRAILEAIEKALSLDKESNRFAYEVLANYGNMSSATVLFVLKNIMNQLSETDKSKNILSCAFGPGLTLESMILEVV